MGQDPLIYDGCLCGSGSPDNYEGPCRECPVHGEGVEVREEHDIPEPDDMGYDVLEYERPEDADDALPSYRLALKGCHDWSYIEMQLDAAELELVQRIAKAFDANTAKRCAPTILFDRRVKPGALEFDSNFTGA